MSIGNLDIFCGSVCGDHLTDAITAHLGHGAFDSPVALDALVRLDFPLDRNDQIGTNVADIGEVECGVLIFHTFSIGNLHKKNEKNRAATETFIYKKGLTAVELVFMRFRDIFIHSPPPAHAASIYAGLHCKTD